MNRFKKKAILISLITLFTNCQQATFPTKSDLTKIYTQAIGDFIKAANENNANKFDTLYFGKRELGQPDDFPEIDLPATIRNTYIRVVSTDEGKKIQEEIKSRTYINLMGWISKENGEFQFVVFSNGFEHQYDCAISYKFNSGSKEYELVNLQLSNAKK